MRTRINVLSVARALRSVTAIIGAFAAIGVASPMALAAPYEPNDSVAQAAGPIVGGQPYVAAMETSNDYDYFYFNTTGQRQLDIAVTQTGPTECRRPELLDSEGAYITSGDSYLDVQGEISHILRTSSTALQYVVKIDGNTGCQYSLRVDPADALSTASPGVVAFVAGADEADDIQRIYVDGRLIGQVQGTTGQSFALGQLASNSTITFDAENVTGDWSWDVTLTNQTDRVRTTVFTEDQSGSSRSTRVGLVRHVVMTPSGGLLESCGEALASVSCIPIDADGDGFNSSQDCNDANSAVHPGAPEIVNNGLDDNCDGVSTTRARYFTSVSLHRRAARYSGRVSSGPGCSRNRKVVLRLIGAGKRSFGSAYARRDGTFTIQRSRRLRGTVYVVAAERGIGRATCRVGSSGTIRG